MPTWARPLDRARFAPFWSGKVSSLIVGFPAAVHFLVWAVTSACCVVPFSTATDLPQRSASDVTLGPPELLTKNDVPARKYVTKSTVFSRSFVSPKDDIP